MNFYIKCPQNKNELRRPKVRDELLQKREGTAQKESSLSRSGI